MVGGASSKKRDGAVIISDCRWTLVRNPNGEPAGILQVCTDVTERKRLEARFLRAQRVESIGIFASGIAHDLNNALAPVLVGVEVLKRKLLDQQSRRLLNAIESSAKHGSEMVYQVLSFVKGVGGTHVKLNPWKIVKDITSLLGHIVPRNVSIRTRMADKISPVMGDATQLHQVLINLCANARDAMPQGGELTFSAENVWVTKEMAEEHPDAAEGAYVMFSISDTGVGISPEQVHKIFEPFYTTKEVGKGTGLGLSICLGIIKGHKGFMTVESVEGKGSTFKIFLPVLSATKVNMKEGELQQEFHRYIIFVVNSENEYLHAFLNGLGDHGYEPLLAVGKSQVTETLLQYLGKVQIVVLEGFLRDETPAMMKSILEIEPQARFILLANKSQLDEIRASGTPQPHVVLEQPVSIETLLEAIERLTLCEKKSA